MNALMHVAKRHLDQSRPLDALATLRLLRALSPREREIAALHGVAAQRGARLQEAIDAYETYCALGGSDLTARVNLAECYLHEAQLDRALEVLAGVISEDSQVRHSAGFRARMLVLKMRKQMGARS